MQHNKNILTGCSFIASSSLRCRFSQAEDLIEQSRGIANDKAARPPIVCERLLSMEEQGQ